MGHLWRLFTDKLASCGYTLEDLNGNDALFQILAEEVCGFSSQEVSEIRKNWRWHQAQNKDGLTSVCSGAPLETARKESFSADTSIASQGAIEKVYPTSTVLSRAAVLLSHMNVDGVVMSPASVIELPVSRTVAKSFRGRVASLHNPSGELELMWCICNPKAVLCLKEGQPLASLDNMDLLCPGGIVLYRENGNPARFLKCSPAELFCFGWCLVAFDAAVGKSRRLEEDEVRLLQNFSMGEFFNSLNNDGYDSIRVASRNAFVFFHPHQLLPRFVVTVQVHDTSKQNYSDKTTVNVATNTTVGVNAQGSVQPQWTPSRNEQSDKIDERSARKGMQVNVSSISRKQSFGHSNTSAMCGKHPTKEVEFWCPDEKKLLCSHCLFYDGYSKSNCIFIPEGVKHEAEGLGRWVENAKIFLREIKSVEDLFRAAEGDIIQSEEGQKEELCEQFQRVRTKLNSLEERLLVQLKDKAARQLHSLCEFQADVQATVDKVRRLIDGAEEPLAINKEGDLQYEAAVAFLRTTQLAFGKWNAIPISMYSVVKGLERDIFKELDTVLDLPIRVVEADGNVELPEAIDVNYLKKLA